MAYMKNVFLGLVRRSAKLFECLWLEIESMKVKKVINKYSNKQRGAEEINLSVNQYEIKNRICR